MKVEAEIQEILKKYHLKMGYDISFPVYKILPDEVKLALSILQQHGMKIVFVLTPQDEEK